MQKIEFQIKPGKPYPHGSKAYEDGVNFSIFSRHAEEVELLLYQNEDSPEPFQIIPLEIDKHRTFFSWHVFVKHLRPGTWYTWRLNGPSDTQRTGLRFDKQKQLLDPWAKAVSDKIWNREVACKPGDNGHCSMRSVVIDEEYDWQGDTPLAIRSEKAIIYELHVKGFTRHPSSQVSHPGAFAGLIEKIPYLKELGITHVELLPVMAFDEQDAPDHTRQLGLSNYWGYSTHSFFSPHPSYCVTPEQGTHQQEFRDLVKALHKAGIGVIMDVVFNHTSEAGPDGPVINFKGMDGNSFYLTDKFDKSIFHDYTGCGNTVNSNHPLVSRFIIGCLEYWVREMHVDGFRFDLASALSRGEDGSVLQDPPIIWGIELSEQLAKTKLIAEAWDAAGLYQVGNFPGYRWAEWNGIYRDTIRRFVRGDRGLVKDVATRICGSSDLYEYQHRLPISGINFVTCHDGFTLNDLFSYNEKHNEANGENSRDGCNNNLSSNCGVEGPSNDLVIQAFRRQQVKNTFAILLISQGVPMLLAGDEFLNTQNGNNNCYCQDNELSWLDWGLLEKNADMFNFVKGMIQLRKRHPALMRRHFLKGQTETDRDINDITWHDADPDHSPQWDSHDAQFLAFSMAAQDNKESDIYIAFNMSAHKIKIKPPVIENKNWRLSVDTSLQSGQELIPPKQQKPLAKKHYSMNPHSVLILENIDSNLENKK